MRHPGAPVAGTVVGPATRGALLGGAVSPVRRRSRPAPRSIEPAVPGLLPPWSTSSASRVPTMSLSPPTGWLLAILSRWRMVRGSRGGQAGPGYRDSREEFVGGWGVPGRSWAWNPDCPGQLLRSFRIKRQADGLGALTLSPPRVPGSVLCSSFSWMLARRELLKGTQCKCLSASPAPGFLDPLVSDKFLVVGAEEVRWWQHKVGSWGQWEIVALEPCYFPSTVCIFPSLSSDPSLSGHWLPSFPCI